MDFFFFLDIIVHIPKQKKKLSLKNALFFVVDIFCIKLCEVNGIPYSIKLIKPKLFLSV